MNAHWPLVSILSMIEETGWAVIGVGGDETGPPFAYTAGLTDLDHPEIIVCGLSMQVSHTLLNDLGRRIKDGARFADGDVLTDLLIEDLPVRFRDATDPNDTVTIARMIYPERTVIQLLCPDADGFFPTDPAYSQERFPQPLI